MSDLTAEDIVASIVNGDQDEHWAEIAKAMKARVDAQHVSVRWWVHFEDTYITVDRMNILAARNFQNSTRTMTQPNGISWDRADPEDVNQRFSLVLAHLIEHDGVSWEQAVEKMRQFTPADITHGEIVETVGAGELPKDGASTG